MDGKDAGELHLPHDAIGRFVSRPNRFLAVMDIEGSMERVHVHDPGRLEELLYPGNHVMVKRAAGKKRSTKWDAIAAKHGEQWVLIHSGYHRPLSEMVLNDPDISPLGSAVDIRPEIMVGHSRLDFVLTSDGIVTGVEVKGCSLAVEGLALFPDAPTVRGAKHLETLVDMRKSGMRAALIVLVFRTDARAFAPNVRTDPRFADTFWKALDKGVEVHPLVFRYDGQKIVYIGKIPVCKPI